MRPVSPADWHALFQSLVKPEWFAGQGRRVLRVRVARIVRTPWEGLLSSLDRLAQSASSASELVELRPLFVESALVQYVRDQVTSQPNGALSILMGTLNVAVGEGYFLAMATPVVESDGSGATQDAYDRLTLYSSLLRAVFGHNVAWDFILDRLVDLDQPPQATDVHAIRKLPQACGSPSFSQAQSACFLATVTALEGLVHAKRGKLQLALEFFERACASAEEFSFVNYWVSIEIICEGKRAPEIGKRLARYYRLRDGKEAEAVLGLTTIFRARDLLMHRGKRPKLEPDVERYVQLIFLELLRHDLGLPCLRLLTEFASGADLSSIGLANHRPQRQDAVSIKVGNYIGWAKIDRPIGDG